MFFIKVLKRILFLISAGNNGQEQQNVQHVASNAPSRRDECLTQPPQLELVGHSIVSVFSFRTILPLPPKRKRNLAPSKSNQDNWSRLLDWRFCLMYKIRSSYLHAFGAEGIPSFVAILLQACASNPYQDQYYGGMIAAYGHQPYVRSIYCCHSWLANSVFLIVLPFFYSK